MRVGVIVVNTVVLIAFGAVNARGQEVSVAPRIVDKPVPLAEQAVAHDEAGQPALGARLRTTGLSGTPDAPPRVVRFVLENRGSAKLSYVSGWVTFYDAQGVRCGEALWKQDALAPGELAETDAPGLRLTCSPVAWRIAATNLVAPSGQAPQSITAAAVTTPVTRAVPSGGSTTATSTISSGLIPPLVININGATLPVQPDNPIEVKIGRELVRIVVSAAP